MEDPVYAAALRRSDDFAADLLHSYDQASNLFLVGVVSKFVSDRKIDVFRFSPYARLKEEVDGPPVEQIVVPEVPKQGGLYWPKK